MYNSTYIMTKLITMDHLALKLFLEKGLFLGNIRI